VDAVSAQRLPHKGTLDAVVGGGEVHKAAVQGLPLAAGWAVDASMMCCLMMCCSMM